ncbi:16S rRNA (adenine(1518)-N(6)/adenine(1519)-N(6))-dimethyltransferase RsmA [Lutispora saccharofermentans]|uniref:Ribosomal RNA small subunit methyltransferase A n=1 Tax=Lutispora saccharofermentans TaxID=3024236 RepID=A0ABT1NCI1_9FIRM|nr:16S rRNA (adenine(1518)-N(6)/adenine(1519)-N(6))-dimethyltransferase RsmA [Lutispora saccharofermentans]MCQ1528973.1 16S rRNA (adenine(1518)-N(6)/adenine(1519)-N(6))-dimethyltransferase RsmA [Lutispora saccharofermentans]
MRDYTLADATRDAMKKFDIRASKKYGQNFLIDPGVLGKILEVSAIDKDSMVLEIGPGLGTMTKQLCERAGKVLAIEIDKDLIKALSINMSGYDNFKLINDDVLRLDLKSLLKENFGDIKARVVANLPYYITSPIIMKLLEEGLNLSSITIMVQKEVAQRIAAAPGGKDYGVLSLSVQYYAIPEIAAIVPAEAFMPMPGVDSAVVNLKIRQEAPVALEDEALFFRVIKAAFAQRRKTLLNALYGSGLNLEKSWIEELLKSCDIDAKRRGETLSMNEFAALSNKIWLFLKK